MKRSFFKLSLFLLILVGIGLTASAAIDVHEFDTEAQRERYQDLLRVLRCPLCQNQNLEDSDAVVAVDLRREVARLVKEGQTDEQVKEYMVNRYGDFVLYEPPVQSNTWLLWWSPVFMLAVGLAVFAVIVVNRRKYAAQGADETLPDSETLDDEGSQPDESGRKETKE